MLKDRLNKYFDDMDFKQATVAPATTNNCDEFVIVSDDGKYSRVAILEAIIRTESLYSEQCSYRVHSIESPDVSLTYKYADTIRISSLPRVISTLLGDCYLLGIVNKDTAVITQACHSGGSHIIAHMADIAWPDNIKWGLDYQEPCDVATDELPNRCREEGV